MKKPAFRLAALVTAFFLGCLGVIALYHFNSTPQFLQAEAVSAQKNADCAKSKSFPGLSREISTLKKGKNDYFAKDAAEFMDEWYGKHLKAMGEKSLLDVSAKNAEVYRFLWLRTFHHPVFVRIERDQNGIKLFTRELDGAGGYEPGKVLRQNEINLQEKEFCEFLRLLEKADYWTLPSENDDSGFDGAQWILEAVKENRYHIVDRWTPRKGEYREACIYLLKLSGVDIDKLKDDLY